MICILGKTCSGKTTIVDELVKNYGFKKITTYTTRPMREGEINHKDYHFINNKEFMNKIREDFLPSGRLMLLNKAFGIMELVYRIL